MERFFTWFLNTLKCLLFVEMLLIEMVSMMLLYLLCDVFSNVSLIKILSMKVYLIA